ncbi:pentatricopeptide repeat-containing protein At4g01030, mitochondrial [Salvia hispanica]|uniref:pentatricopeptide repeat-containing protein At4g01030, mitochondrial n=1 Tax=Salvia hispanica TaxID=49212 RepID=UPI002009A6AB|nr:pentatricopeptide repeat-containing protein At4g01030, mitochondrial [Salvia hispanica]
MEAINTFHHLPNRNFTTKFSQLKSAAVCGVDTASPPPSIPNILSNLSSLSTAKARHAQIIKMPNEEDLDIKVQSLITSYLELQDFHSAAMVFFLDLEHNYLHWNTFLEDFKNKGGDPTEILQVSAELHNMGVVFGSENLIMLLKMCANLRDSWLGLEIHVCLIKRGFDQDMHAKAALMNFYGSCWGSDSAKKVFHETSDHTSLLWNEAVLVALRNEEWFKGVDVFRRMQFSSTKVDSNAFTITRVLQACGKMGALDEGKQIHGYILRKAIESNLSICNSLIFMYSKNGNVEQARAVFDLMQNRNLSTWNAIIFGYAAHGHLDDAWELLREMETYNIKPDIVTWNSLLSGHLHHGSCQEVLNILQHMQNGGFKPNNRSTTAVLQAVSELHYLPIGKEIHCYVIRNGIDSDLHVMTSLLDMYVKNGDLNSARAVFDGMVCRNVFAWNAMISGYSFKGDFEKADKLMKLMKGEGVEPDLVTYNSMVSGYSVAGRIDEALDMMKQIKNSGLAPNVVSWTALISGSCQNGYHRQALDFFYQMQAEGVKPNSATIATLCRACAGLSLLQRGKEAHCISIRNEYVEDAFVCTSLIDMYSKCGSLETAYRVFQAAENKTLASWNSMMMGFSSYGHGKEAISLFHRMREEKKIQPDPITMTALLTGCKHSGLIDEGWRLFDSMETEYRITPTIQHYSCMVDLLARAGYLDEAWDFISQMPVEPDSTVWGAILGSCRTHGSLQLGEIAAKQLFKLEPENPANYVLLMNMYTASERWDDVDRVRDLMERRSLKIGNVWSWIEINNTVHVFSASGKPHQRDGEVYFELYHLVSEIKSMGYLPDTKCVHLNTDDEREKEKALLSHTEKRAITFGLIQTKTNTPVRVIKNTTICADCHTFAEYTSLLRKREIILKDGIRFHHFKEGKCSCRGLLR